MFSQLRRLLASVLSHLPAALVLVLLGGVGLLGYFNDWKLPRFFDAEGPSDPAEQPAPEEPADSGPSLKPIRLSAEAIQKSGIETAPVEERPMVQYAHAHGSFDYDQTRYARLSPRATGVVWQVYRQTGDAVRRGDLLAVVESAEVGKAKAAFLLSLVQAENKEKALQGVREASASVPSWSQREAGLQLSEARAHLFADQQALFNLGLPITFEEVTGQAEDKVMRRLRLLGLPASIVASLDPNTATANLLPVTAPFDGVVVSRTAVVGEEATPAHPLFIVADLGRVWVTCEVRLEDVGLLRAGQEILVRPDGAAVDSPPGRLIQVSAEADEKTHTVQARAEILNSEGTLRPNTPFEGNIVIRREPHALAVLNQAVQWAPSEADGDKKAPSHLVFVRISGEEFEPRIVGVGLRDEKYTELLSGLRPGEKVVTKGSHVLKAEWLKSRIGGDD
jgi:cobalt-zinc-cadmium efflux system membrane fusion protein